MRTKKLVNQLVKCVNALHKRLKRIEENKPFEINTENLSMEHIDNLIELKKNQIQFYQKDLCENPQSCLTKESLLNKIHHRYDELSRLYVVKSLKEKELKKDE